MEPALEIRMVWENLALAMAVWAGAKKGLITKDHLPTGNSVVPAAPGTLERVYNPLELRNEQDLCYHINNTAAVKNKDGTVAFLFKQSCAEADANCLEVPSGRFDLATRYYLPKESIRSGEWKLPLPELE